MRKIIHCDCDCFYAAIEMRDDSTLRGRPLAVGGTSDQRGVVATCNYEAREFGIRSAMSTAAALRRCPDLLVVPPRMDVYREVSQQIHRIFRAYTPLIEPLSLDEAYLDVTHANACRGSATLIAEQIRTQVRETLGITLSAGVAPNKFLAKVASDWNKPDGQFVLSPARVDAFLVPLPVARIPGVGRVMQGRLAELGVRTVGELRAIARGELQQRFGSFGLRLYERARGIDERPVQPHQPVQSISSEDTFEKDLPLDELEEVIRRLADKTWAATRKTERVGRTVVLKLKTDRFRILTRSHTPDRPPASAAELADIALALRARVELPETTRYRLAGVGLAGFRDPGDVPDQPLLFEQA